MAKRTAEASVAQGLHEIPHSQRHLIAPPAVLMMAKAIVAARPNGDRLEALLAMEDPTPDGQREIATERTKVMLRGKLREMLPAARQKLLGSIPDFDNVVGDTADSLESDGKIVFSIATLSSLVGRMKATITVAPSA